MQSGSSVRYTEDISKDIAGVVDDIDEVGPSLRSGNSIDLQYRTAEVQIVGSPDVERLSPDENLLDQAAELLQQAERPIIWAGGGVNISGAAHELTALAERLGAPVVTTIEGRGSISEAHEFSLGFRTDRVLGMEIFEDADLVFAVGTRFQNYATRVWTLPMPENLIHVDVDPEVIGKTIRLQWLS